MKIALKGLCLAAGISAALACQACGNKASNEAQKKDAVKTDTSDNKTKSAPKAEIVGNDTHEFTVIQGDAVEHTFKIRNAGTGELNLLKARGS